MSNEQRVALFAEAARISNEPSNLSHFRHFPSKYLNTPNTYLFDNEGWRIYKFVGEATFKGKTA